MTKDIFMVHPLTQSQKYFLTAAFALIGLFFFFIGWFWRAEGMMTVESQQIRVIASELWEKQSITTSLDTFILYGEGDYGVLSEFAYRQPLHMIAILATISVVGFQSSGFVGMIFLTLSIIFLTWKVAEELFIQIDQGDEQSRFFIQVLVWLFGLIAFSWYWTPWLSPELLYTMLVLASMYNMFRFYRLRSYPDAALAIIWLIFSMVIAKEVFFVSAVIWFVWMIQFVLLSRKSKVVQRTIFLLSLTLVVVGGYWVQLQSQYELGFFSNDGFEISLIHGNTEGESDAVLRILQDAELYQNDSQIDSVNSSYYGLLVFIIFLLLLGVMVVDLYHLRSTMLFMVVSILLAVLLSGGAEWRSLLDFQYLSPYTIFLLLLIAMRVFRKLPEIYRFSLSGVLVIVLLLTIYGSGLASSTARLDFDDEVILAVSELDDEFVVFGNYPMEDGLYIYDERLQHVPNIADQIVVWDSLYKAQYQLVHISDVEVVTYPYLEESNYFREVLRSQEWVLYERQITYSP